jgi:hypothetical protein
MVQPDSPQLTIWRTRISLWEPKATKTRSAYVIVIALPLQQRLHERVSMLRYTYMVSRVEKSLRVVGVQYE